MTTEFKKKKCKKSQRQNRQAVNQKILHFLKSVMVAKPLANSKTVLSHCDFIPSLPTGLHILHNTAVLHTAAGRRGS